MTHYTVTPRIMDFLEQQKEPLTLGAIARGAEVNRVSVRKLLAELGDRVEVDRTFPGSPTYQLKPYEDGDVMYQIDYVVRRRRPCDPDFVEIGFGTSAGWSNIAGASYAIETDIERRQWETTDGMPDPISIDRSDQER
jgi:hypothetical protein